MAEISLSKRDREAIDRAVGHFEDNRGLFVNFAESLIADFTIHPDLAPLIHFLKHRIKDPEHLRKKLERKTLEGKRNGNPVQFDEKNVFEKMHDLAGVRIIHLHTEQMKVIHRAIQDIISEKQLCLVEEPTANCWDIEYEKIFEQIGVTSRSRDSMYTTVHYVVRPNERIMITCEVQVRTLMDEVWGEVSHRINYPEESPNSVCRDQLKVLARFTTGCTRLVDSIFRLHQAAVDGQK